MSYAYKARKIVAILSSDLAVGIALNVLGHLAISLGAYGDDLMGRRQLCDASGTMHSGISKYPLIITKLRSSKLNALIDQAKKCGEIFVVDYPEQMLHTGHDDDLAKALAAVNHHEIKYLGALLYGETGAIDALTGKFSLWC